MVQDPTEPEAALEFMLSRSLELEEAIFEILAPGDYGGSDRFDLCYGLFGIAIEHWQSLRFLMAAGNHTSAVALMRLEFEAVARSLWLLHVGSDADVAKQMAPLTKDSERLANSLPTITDMIKGLEVKGPKGAADMLNTFKDANWSGLNSFVHGGIHALNRHLTGYPLHLVLQIIQSSNALATMAGMTLANTSGDEAIGKAFSKIQPRFHDCLPVLLPQ